MAKWLRLRGSRGYGLLPLLTAMPVMVALLCSFALALTFGIRAYVHLLGDMELQKQVQFAAERIRSDLLYAIDAKATTSALRISADSLSATPDWVEYRLTQTQIPRLTRNTQPVTGDTSIGQIGIISFQYRQEGARTVWYEITGKNFTTGHEYVIETAVTLPLPEMST